MLSYITWTVDPVLVHLFGLEVRWYGLMWAIGFLLGYLTESRIYKREGLTPDHLDSFFVYMAIGTLVGARIGHCLFYDFEYYSSHIIEIFVPKGGFAGLSSHGGAFGILLSLWLFHKRVVQKSYLWVLDRTVIAVAICGACIRMGNLFNHEIYGYPTDLPWGFRFVDNVHAWMNGAEPIFTQPSHPTQLYEVAYCLITFALLLFLYWKTEARKYDGFIFGVFLVLVFLTRFLLEFIKNNQEAFEDDMLLNMGQLLSLPFFLYGFYCIYKAGKAWRADLASSTKTENNN